MDRPGADRDGERASARDGQAHATRRLRVVHLGDALLLVALSHIHIRTITRPQSIMTSTLCLQRAHTSTLCLQHAHMRCPFVVGDDQRSTLHGPPVGLATRTTTMPEPPAAI